MISCIICSRDDILRTDIIQNIGDTIDVEYEIIVIDNKDGAYSIFSAYSEGVRRSKGDILCFVHEDLVFGESGWGTKIVRHFSDEGVGAVGFAGSHFVSSAPMYWYEMPFISEHNLTNGIPCHNWLSENASLSDVAVIDGMCMFIRRSLFGGIAFDEITFSGFHVYDMDICMQVIREGYRVCVCDDIVVNHLYRGGNNLELLERGMNIFVGKWREYLPLCVGLNGLTECTVRRINNLCMSAYDSRKARNSRSYRLGYRLLHPMSIFRKKH